MSSFLGYYIHRQYKCYFYYARNFSQFWSRVYFHLIYQIRILHCWVHFGCKLEPPPLSLFTKQSCPYWLVIYLWYRASCIVIVFVFLFNFEPIKKVRKHIYNLLKSPYSLKHHVPYVHFNKTTWFFYQKTRAVRFFLALINFLMTKNRVLERCDA